MHKDVHCSITHLRQQEEQPPCLSMECSESRKEDSVSWGTDHGVEEATGPDKNG